MTKLLRPSFTVLVIGVLVLSVADVIATEQSSSIEQPRFAYIYLNDENTANSFKELLEDNGLGSELIELDEVPTTNFDQFTAVIVASDIKKAWSTSAANLVRNTKKPVLGLGEGGYYFFGKLQLAIGSPHGWHGGDVAVRPVKTKKLRFWSSFDLKGSDRKELVLYAESGHVGLHLPEPAPGIVLLGRELVSSNHYLIVEQDQRYVLWGFTASPKQMTTLGKQLFVHTCRYLAMVHDDRRSDGRRSDGEPQQENIQSEAPVAIVERLRQLEERVARLESPTVKKSAVDLSSAANESFTGDESFSGEWETIANDDRGITQLSIRKRNEGQWSIQAWGACHPTDCDWGTTSFHLLGDTVSARKFPYGFATWDHGFTDVYLTLRIEKDELVVETYGIFKDNSGRSNYRSEERFRHKTSPSETSHQAASTASVSRQQNPTTTAVPTPSSKRKSPADEVANKVRPLGSADSHLRDESLAVFFTYGPVNGARTLVQANWDGTVRSYLELPYSVSGLAADTGRLLATIGGSRVGQGRVFSISQQGVVETVFRDKEVLFDTSKIWSNVNSDEFLVVDHGADVVVAVPKDDSRPSEVRIRLVDRPNYQSNSVAKCSDGSILYSDSDENGVFRVPVGSGTTLGEPLLTGMAAVAARLGSNTWVAALKERLHVFEGDRPIAELPYPEGMVMFRPNIDFASDGTLVLAFHTGNRQYFYAVDLDKKQFTGLFTVDVDRLTSLAIAPKMDWASGGTMHSESVK